MKNYFVEFTNGDCEWFEARTDNSAYNKAWKMAKKAGTRLDYLAETSDETEEDRVILRR